MDINKALRKQKKSYKRFLLSMGFIFLMLPIVLIASGRMRLFFVIYLSVIECLILVSMFVRMHHERLWYEYKQYKLEIRQGRMNSRVVMFCEKVCFIHVEKQGPGLEITIVASSKFRSKNMKLVEKSLLFQKPSIRQALQNIMKRHPENKYYYITIREGGILKYKLLDTLYTSCVYAEFTDKAIEAIKEYRGQ